MQLSDKKKEEIFKFVDDLLKNIPDGREQLIPILQQVQACLGYLPGLAMQKIARLLSIPEVDLYGLATFYNQFRLHPPGKRQIKVCMGTACYMAGSRVALESFERRLQIRESETTPDGEFSLERVACVGCCTMAPVVVVNGAVEGRVTPTRVEGIIFSFSVNGAAVRDEAKSQAAEKALSKAEDATEDKGKTAAGEAEKR